MTARAPLALLALLILAGCAPERTADPTQRPPAMAPAADAAAETGPRLVVEQLAHDAGVVDAGTVIRHEFRLRNEGDAPLEVEAKPTCGCTVTQADEIIPAGRSGRVLAEMDTSSLQGPVNKLIHVLTNDPSQPRATLRMRAEVQLGVRVLPRQRLVLTGNVLRMDPETLLLVAADGAPFDVLEISTENDWLETWIRPRPDRARPAAKAPAPEARPAPAGAVTGGHAAYELEVKPSQDAAPGRFTDLIRLRTTHPAAPELRILVEGDLDVGLVVEPRLLFFLHRGEDSQSETVRIARQDGGPLALLSAETTDEALSARIEPLPGGGVHDVVVQRDPSRHEPGSVNESELVLRTDYPGREELRIPIIAR